MGDRPNLEKGLERGQFLQHYYLKEELADFCRAEGLPASGGKGELTERVACYLESGRVIPAGRAGRGAKPSGEISEDTEIEPDLVCSQKHRAFFRERLGKTFSFCVEFQNWLKSNAGKTYGEAVQAYRDIVTQKKQGRTVIGKQFEYNAYIRDFFADNPGKTLEQAIACWTYKKAQAGSHRYTREDLSALTH